MKTLVVEEKKIEYTSLYRSLLKGRRYSIDGEDLIASIQWEKEEFMNDMPISAYWKDSDGVILGCNEYMLQMFNLKDKKQIIGKTNYDVFAPSRAQELEEIDQKVMRTGETFVQEELAEVFVGEQRELHLFLSIKKPLRDKNNAIIGIQGVSIDLTKQREAEQKAAQERQQRLIAEEEQLATTLIGGSLSHDAKNRLTAPRMRLEMLVMVIQKLKTEGYAALSPRELEILFSYPQMAIEGLDELHQELTATDQYLRDRSLDHQAAAQKHAKVQFIHKTVKEVIHNYHQQWEIQIYDSVKDFEFLGDKMSVYKIMGNLLRNAYRQIQEKGQGEIFIRSFQTAIHNILEVKDTAGGITQELVDRMLDLYKTQEVKGTGIGLSSAQVLMKDMKGHLEVHLVEGDKIAFQLFFPKIS